MPGPGCIDSVEAAELRELLRHLRGGAGDAGRVVRALAQAGGNAADQRVRPGCCAVSRASAAGAAQPSSARSRRAVSKVVEVVRIEQSPCAVCSVERAVPRCDRGDAHRRRARGESRTRIRGARATATSATSSCARRERASLRHIRFEAPLSVSGSARVRAEPRGEPSMSERTFPVCLSDITPRWLTEALRFCRRLARGTGRARRIDAARTSRA